MQLSDDVKFPDWLEYGINRGWVSQICCATHDGVPGTPEEEEIWEAGHDPCVPALRIWDEAAS